MQRAGAGNGDFGRGFRARRKRAVILKVDRLCAQDAAADARHRLHPALWRLHGKIFRRHVIGHDVAELAKEIAVVGAPPQLAVGDKPKAQPLLKRDSLVNRLVFCGAQIVVVQAPGGIEPALFQ